jgi:hypothetical protein
MSDEKKNRSANIDDEALQREILRERKFSMEEAIARRAGKDLMKGASPVTLQRRAAMAIEHFLDQYLLDSECALAEVLLRQARESEVLFKMNYEQPLVALGKFLESILGSEGRLQDFVTQVDAYWGQKYYERPHFQKPGAKADADDPYTFSSVSKKLTQLLQQLQME